MSFKTVCVCEKDFLSACSILAWQTEGLYGSKAALCTCYIHTHGNRDTDKLSHCGYTHSTATQLTDTISFQAYLCLTTTHVQQYLTQETFSKRISSLSNSSFFCIFHTPLHLYGSASNLSSAFFLSLLFLTSLSTFFCWQCCHGDGMRTRQALQLLTTQEVVLPSISYFGRFRSLLSPSILFSHICLTFSSPSTSLSLSRHLTFFLLCLAASLFQAYLSFVYWLACLKTCFWISLLMSLYEHWHVLSPLKAMAVYLTWEKEKQKTLEQNVSQLKPPSIDICKQVDISVNDKKRFKVAEL